MCRRKHSSQSTPPHGSNGGGAVAVAVAVVVCAVALGERGERAAVAERLDRLHADRGT